jgi:hypothetical protein
VPGEFSIPELRKPFLNDILGHLATAAEAGEAVDLNRLLPLAEQALIAKAFGESGFVSLSAVREKLGNRFDYGLLRLVRAAMIQNGRR